MKKLSLFLIIILLGCNSNNLTEDKLENIISKYEDFRPSDSNEFPLGEFSREHFKNIAEFSSDLLDELNDIDFNKLNERDRISAELLKFVLNDRIDYYEFERFLNPLLSDSGFHISLGFIVRPISSFESAKNYLKRLNSIDNFVDQHLGNLRESLKKGTSQPKVIFKGYESTYNSHITKTVEENHFFSPFKNLPDNINDLQKDSIITQAKLAIENKVIPQFKRIKEFFETEYIPNTRETIGVSEIPNGLKYYQNRINYYTTSNLYDPKSIHEIGLSEVKRIKDEMFKIIEDLNFQGNFSDFLNYLRTDSKFYADSPEELLMIARDMAKRADEQLPRFFKTLPRKPYGVAPVPSSIAPKYTGGRYVGTSKNSTQPGYYWVNTYNLKSRKLYTLPSLTVHEAVPGHHLQGSLNNELSDDIPQFRRNLYLSAYGEGWGLYTEFLAEEMGMYTTPYEHFGKLTYEMWRASRLVVDTGIHALGWTRDQAIDFMASNTALSLHEINTEVDRYISWPGQALSYKIGELKIRELRKIAEEKLQSKFDIRDFHEVILEEGTVTLAILEERIMNYINNSLKN
jgi:uncharacterized protein (DUF885 family)